MDDLLPDQYEAVLKYIEATNEEDFDNAVRILRNHQFNLQNAIASRFAGYQDQQSQPLFQPQQNPQPQPNRQPNQNAEQQVRKYLEYMREKQNRSIFMGIFNFMKSLICGIFGGIFELFMPQFLKRKIIRSRFYNQYVDELPVLIDDRPLQKLLKRNYLGRKPVMFLVGSLIEKYQCFSKIMANPKIARKIKQSFIVSGSNEENPSHFFPLQQRDITKRPSILILRQNVLEKPQVIHNYTGEQQISQITVDGLNLVLRAYQYQNRKDNNTIIRYRNYLRQQYYRGRPGIYEEQIQLDEQYNNFIPQSQSSSTMSQNLQHASIIKSQMIQEQNEEYRKVEEQMQEKKQKEMQEMKKMEEMMEERKIRKMSIPDEPESGDNIIRINFRCPDGQMKTRNFLDTEQIDLLYHWVETNQEIEFEDNARRQFQLMYSFPPTALCDQKSQLLKDIFDSDHQKLMIRQL